MDGLLIIDKLQGITSHDVVSRVRRVLKTKRVGHTGTLDPFATGVMVILVGQATRLARFLDKDVKEYEALVRFGFETDTGDLTGERSGDERDDNEVAETLRTTDWDKVLDEFRGEIQQVPPMYSAKKVAGKKLYEHARKGETIEREPVNVRIYELESEPPAAAEMRLRVVCSAGTYIRTLAEDIGRRIGVGAHLTELRRTRAGKFTIEETIQLRELKQMTEPSNALLPVEQAVAHLPVFILGDERVEKTRNGLSTRTFDTTFSDGEFVRLTSETGELMAIGAYNEAENTVEPKVVLI